MNTLTGGDLQGNIRMGDIEGGMVPKIIQGANMVGQVASNMPAFPMPPQPQQSKRRSTLPPEFKNLDTLDEPVCETIVS